MSAPHLDVQRLLHDQGYALDPDQLAEACAHHPEQLCALLAAAGTIAATRAQITVLTDAANLLCDVHASSDADTVLSLRERLDRVADALTAALAQHDKAIAALRHTCGALIRTDLAVLSIPECGNPAESPRDATDSTP